MRAEKGSNRRRPTGRVPCFQKLLKMSQQQSQSAYKQAQHDLIDYLDRRVFSVHLVDPSRVTAHEIFCYSDGSQAKHHIRGSLRAVIHTGLSDPQIYLDVSARTFHANKPRVKSRKRMKINATEHVIEFRDAEELRFATFIGVLFSYLFPRVSRVASLGFSCPGVSPILSARYTRIHRKLAVINIAIHL